MIEKLIKSIYKRIEHIPYLPQSVVFVMDMFTVLAGISLAVYIAPLLFDVQHSWVWVKVFVTLAVYAATELFFKTHVGILRYSSLSDLYKIVKANFTAIILLVIGGYIWNYHIQKHISATSAKLGIISPILGGILILGMQLGMRLLVRVIYEDVRRFLNTKNKKNALILGDDAEAANIARLQRANTNSAIYPIGFISTSVSETTSSQRIINLPIIPISQVENFIKKNKVKAVLMTASKIAEAPKALFDRLILDNLELLKVNIIIGDLKDNRKFELDKMRIEDLLGRNSIQMDSEEVGKSFEDECVLITGAAGSIGSELAKQISRLRCKKLLLLDQAETPLNDLWLELSNRNTSEIEIVPVVANIYNEAKMRHCFEKHQPKLVFHAAAYKHVPMMELHPCTAIMTNVQGTKILADLSVEFKVKRFAMISTDKAVNPTSVMGATKRVAEIYIQSLYFRELAKKGEDICQFVTTRFGNVLGSNGSVVPLFKKQIESGGPVTITHRDIIRYFMSTPEACSLVLEAGCIGNGGEIYIFDMGEAVRIYDLAEKMIRLVGKIPGRDIKIAEIGLRPGEKLYEELLANAEETVPTYHPKLMIARVRQYEYRAVNSKVKTLISEAAKFNNVEECVRMLKEIVPEYVSQNSRFEKLDEEK